MQMNQLSAADNSMLHMDVIVWKDRCMRLYSRLMDEKAKLARIQLQLEMKLKELAETPCSIKPTAL